MSRPFRYSLFVGRLRGGGLATESVWGLAVELSMMVSMILTFTFLGRSLGPTGYAPYVTLYAIVSPLVTLAASGVTLALLQHAVRDREPLPETARSCLSLSLLLGGLLTLLGMVVASFIVDDLAFVAIISILLTEFVTTPVVMVAATTVQAATGYIGAAKIRIALVGARVVLVGVLFVTSSLSITSLGVGSLVISGAIALVVLRRVGSSYRFLFRPGRVKLHHLKTNAVYSVGISAASLNQEGDKAVLAANHFVEDTGLYGAAYRIVNLGMVPVSTLVNVSHKRFLEHEEGSRGQHLRRAVKFAGLTGLYGLFVAVVLVIAAPLLPLLVGDEFEGSVEMVRWLSPLVFLRAVTMFPLNGLMGLGKTFLRSLIIVVNAAVAMAMYIVLIPRHGWSGAVAGTLVSEGLLLMCTWGALIHYQRLADRAIDTEPAFIDGGV